MTTELLRTMDSSHALYLQLDPPQQVRAEYAPTGILLRANTLMAEIMDGLCEKLEGRHHGQLLEATDADIQEEQLWAVLRTGKAQRVRERCVDIEGRVWLITSIYQPVTDNTGTVIRVLQVANATILPR